MNYNLARERSLKSLVKYQLSCLGGKQTILIFLLSLVLALISNIMLATNMERFTEGALFQVTCSEINKTLLSLFSIIIWSSMTLAKNSQVAIIMLDWVKNRFLFLMSQLIALAIITCSLAGLFLVLHSVIGFAYFNNFHLTQFFWKMWISSLICGIIYGLYSYLIGQLWSNSLVVVLPIIIFVVSQNLDPEGFLSSLFKLLFIKGHLESFISVIYYIWYICLLVVLNIYIFNKRDLNFT